MGRILCYNTHVQHCAQSWLSAAPVLDKARHSSFPRQGWLCGYLARERGKGLTNRFWMVAAHICAVVGMCTSVAFAADPTIAVEARQRYPWNGLVDLRFTIIGEAGKTYDTSFTAKDMVGNTNIAMRTIRKADGTAADWTPVTDANKPQMRIFKVRVEME
ncbi:MAG: hypothetical protein II894_00310 [Bacteroidales bacterium]|nr:hypothetical protein [Bacteroidales bacterium]